MYAMVNVQQYQIVATGNTVESCRETYNNLMITNRIIDGEAGQSGGDITELKGKITEIRSADIDGNTWFYIRLAESDKWFTVSAKDDPTAVILSAGDKVTVKYIPSDSAIIAANSVK
jgi:hypothetical protein